MDNPFAAIYNDPLSQLTNHVPVFCLSPMDDAAINRWKDHALAQDSLTTPNPLSRAIIRRRNTSGQAVFLNRPEYDCIDLPDVFEHVRMIELREKVALMGFGVASEGESRYHYRRHRTYDPDRQERASPLLRCCQYGAEKWQEHLDALAKPALASLEAAAELQPRPGFWAHWFPDKPKRPPYSTGPSTGSPYAFAASWDGRWRTVFTHWWNGTARRPDDRLRFWSGP